MKPSGVGRRWIRQPWDPEYTPSRDISPTRAVLNKKDHMSDRAVVSLNGLWLMTSEQQMDVLLDGGLLTDECVDKSGNPLRCPGVMRTFYSSSGGEEKRKLVCSGVPNKHRHRFHWLMGSIFDGHRMLTVREVVGLVYGFAKNMESKASLWTQDSTRIQLGPCSTACGWQQPW